MLLETAFIFVLSLRMALYKWNLHTLIYFDLDLLNRCDLLSSPRHMRLFRKILVCIYTNVNIIAASEGRTSFQRASRNYNTVRQT